VTAAWLTPSDLSRLWDEGWLSLSKLPYELRAAHERWVRFHALSGSKRYPDTASEYETVLARHNTVLAELVTTSACWWSRSLPAPRQTKIRPSSARQASIDAAQRHPTSTAFDQLAMVERSAKLDRSTSSTGSW
jgi:hypothetical protein